jgi:hypothetical protein
MGLFFLFGIISGRAEKHRIIGGLPGFFWIWMGAVYHIVFFTAINPAAYIFGGAFILQGIFFLVETYRRNKINYTYKGSNVDYLAVFFILFGLLIYPAISYLLAGSLSTIISFGLPCPTTIATFGFLMLARKNLPKYLVIIPTLWALIGTTAAISFGVIQDFMLLFSAVVANIFIFFMPEKKQTGVISVLK